MTAMTVLTGSRAWERTLSQRRWATPAVLAAPFVVGVAALRGMTVALPIFHGSDELTYHYPTILGFARQLPFPNFDHYVAAQTPLFHLLIAYAGKLTGYELWRLRLLEVLISYGLALAVFALLHRRLRLERITALALTILFVLSPYVFGSSFRLLTDNLALLFTVLALERFERFRETGGLGPFIAGCASVSAAVLTRQSEAFLLGVALFYAARPGAAMSVRDRLVALLAVAVAAVPAGLLFLSWHGLVPPGSDTSSCGLCAGGRGGSAARTLEVPSAELALAAIGLYGAVLFAPPFALRLRGSDAARFDARRVALELRGPLMGAAAGVILLAAFPASPGSHAAGLLWKVASRAPTVRGSSLAFWALVPLAGAVLWARISGAPRRWLVVVFLGCFLLSTLVIRYPWQKYVDPFVLLALLMTVRAREFSSPLSLAGAAVLAIGFLAYTLDFSSHQAVAPASSTASVSQTDKVRRAGVASRNFGGTKSGPTCQYSQ